MRFFRSVPLVALGTCLVGLSVPSPAANLVRGGKAAGAIQLAEGEAAEVEEAAVELGLYLEKISGAAVPTKRLKPGEATQPGILLGKLAEEAGLHVQIRTVSREAFRIRTRQNQVLIAGESPVAVRHGSYKLLEVLGVRWFTPGELGEVVPRSSNVVVPQLDILDQPDAAYRRFWYGGKQTRGEVLLWNRRNRNAGYRGGSFRHAWSHLVSRDLIEKHPEYFSLNDGRRTTRQLCTTHPAVVRVAAETLIADMDRSQSWIFPAGPNDGGGLCQCDSCPALDTPDYPEPSSGQPNCSDRILDFANRVAALTSREHPDRLISFLVYSGYSRVPQQVKHIHPNVIPMITPIRRCRFHGPGNPICPHAQLLDEEIRGWAKMSNQLGFYPYNYNLADALLPFCKVSAYKAYQKTIQELGLSNLAWDFETLDAWSIYAPHLYLSARLMWDIDLDIDATMRDFYEKFYGPAAGPMQQYWDSLDRAYAETPAHAGSYFDSHLVFTPQRMKLWQRQLQSAKGAGAEEPHRTRVAMAAAGFDCARYFLKIREAMNACRFSEAKRQQDRLFAHLDRMAEDEDPDWTHTRYSQGYYNAFVGKTIEDGARVFQSGGRLVVQLPDEWRFAKDEQNEGMEQHWFSRDYDDSQWRLLKTYSASWEEQGLGWYKQSPAWYRVWIDIPAQHASEDLRLWFGGVDETAKVYVNGQEVGTGQGFARPFEFPVGHLLQYGRKNLIAVKCQNRQLGELGTGGILRPVMLYAAGSKEEEER